MEREIKLSEAIREGAKLRPMGTEAYFSFDYDSGKVCSCVLGAALEGALEGQIKDAEDIDGMNISHSLIEHWPVLGELWSPFKGSTFVYAGYSLLNVIAEMNDSGKFTREEIADWLESIGA